MAIKEEKKMRTILITVSISCILVFCPLVLSDSTLYSNDFSSDPGWTTDQSGNFYWNSSANNYHAKTLNQYPGYSPSRYAYVMLPQFSGSFTLQWDIEITRCDTSAGIGFGLYNSKLASGIYAPSDPSIQAQLLVSDLSFIGLGVYHGLGVYTNATGTAGSSISSYNFINPYWNFNKWYTCYLNYDAVNKLIVFDFVPQEGGDSIWNWSKTLTGISPDFTQNLRYLGISASGIGDSGNYGSLIQSAVAEGYIDNVILTIPEPATLFLLCAGLVFARQRHKQI